MVGGRGDMYITKGIVSVRVSWVTEISTAFRLEGGQIGIGTY